jgi:hypothetical protein
MDLAEFVFWIMIVCSPVLVLAMGVIAAYPNKGDREYEESLMGSQDVDQRKIN